MDAKRGHTQWIFVSLFVATNRSPCTPGPNIHIRIILLGPACHPLHEDDIVGEMVYTQAGSGVHISTVRADGW